jgi:hypothetical protein
VQFEQLQGLTGLPVTRLRRRFRNEEVRAALPARIETGTTESLLVATTQALAIVTTDPRRADGRWMTRWVPWDEVRLSDGTDPWTVVLDDTYELFVHVGTLVFVSSLAGDAGRKALRDFVVAVQVGTSAAPL